MIQYHKTAKPNISLFQKTNLKEAAEIKLEHEQGNNTRRSIFTAELSKVYH